ncbi:helix-turn-helix domain-containing protein [Treponema phagedenis]|uniref:helix-turn-helix domain-containing protein n=1 Tax=Treponema phagedenis TaxID=162 RepID=UPI0004B55AA1|nr:S24 family peptidase [Treponema phagedenis]NVP22823.1 helix-turn-helix domain-containing protein [Treponema phagedenis]NVP23806.1 helix-turn-helix domain-containing protein [Treponema phagedenis]QLC57725.1 helix-turn-helix domain-containing protein [Treponema phagedenis]QLC58618.1 helix-turn-helix domain-containing protein [Treponema phagedenis]
MIGDRLKKIREKKGLNQGEFAAFLGVSQQNLSHYENNKRDISETVKIKLQQNGVNLNWLLTGTGEPFLNGDSEPDKPAILQELENTALNATASKFADYDERLNAIEQEQQKLRQEWEEIIQLYSPENMKKPENPRKSIIRTMGSTGEVHERLAYYGADGEEEETEDLPLAENLAAGFPIEAFNEYETYPVPKRFLKKRHKYCVAKIKGTSMTAAGIADGSHVLLEYCNSPVNGSIMVVKYGENTTLKRLHQTDEGEWQLLFEDGSGAMIPLKEGDWEAKAKFIAVL